MGKQVQLWIVRHGATEWSESGQHTSFTDLPLLDLGRENATKLAPILAQHEFADVLCSPLLRARQTAECAGFPNPEITPDLTEWNYGPGEGLTTAQIHEHIPDWTIFTHGAPTFEREGYGPGETREQVTERMDRVVQRVRDTGGDVLCFGHGHILRALTVRWLGVDIGMGAHFPLETGKFCVLGWEHVVPGVVRWNLGG